MMEVKDVIDIYRQDFCDIMKYLLIAMLILNQE